MSALSTETWGDGTRVVLVHGSVATGTEEWHAQQPLANEGFQLVVPDRRGYGSSPPADGEDFLRDAEDLAELLDDGAHLVGHSYGGLGVMVAAAHHPDETRSLALLEPPTFTLAQHDPAARELVERDRELWDRNDLPDGEWIVHFLTAVGTDPADLTPELRAELEPMVPVLRRGRPAWDVELPLDELAAVSFPKLVVSGGHHAGWEAICDELAEQIGASRSVVRGAGHEIQFAGGPINETMLELWRTA